MVYRGGAGAHPFTGSQTLVEHSTLAQDGSPPEQTPARHTAPALLQGFVPEQMVSSGIAVPTEHCPVEESQTPALRQSSTAVHTTGFEPAHAPPVQTSVCVQASPSLQPVPSLAAGFEHAPDVGSHAPAAWHWSEGVHVTGLVPTHAPAVQRSTCVQPFPSEHPVPSASEGFEQAPVVESQTPAAWHWSAATQTTGLAPEQMPLAQASTWVQALPSLQDEPSATEGLEQVPLVGLQLPATWHWSEATHVTGFAPVHVPLWQESACVHAFPSVQVVPFAATGFEHCPVAGAQTPATWHWSAAAHVTGFVPVHVPLWQESVWVQAFPSLQVVPFAAAGLEH